MSNKEQAKTKSIVSNQVIKPVVAGLSAYLLSRLLIGDENFRSVVLGVETASGVVIGTNIAPYIPVSHMGWGISSTVSEKTLEIRAVEVGSTIAGTMISDIALFGSKGINGNLMKRGGIVVLADVIAELAVDMIEGQSFSYLG
jgi:hypothetical protein